MQLSRARSPYTIPSYSLTGDLLAYLNCGLQYRYQNRGSLPPSTPVQLWFGEFIHAVMEEAYLRWDRAVAPRTFPWDWATTVRPVELEVFRRLRASGLVAPFNLFCPHDPANTAGPRCTCRDPGRDEHRLLASRRAQATINTWAASLFPLISEAEVNVRGIRPMPAVSAPRSNYYEVSATIDVLGSVKITASPPGNPLLHHLQANAAASKRPSLPSRAMTTRSSLTTRVCAGRPCTPRRGTISPGKCARTPGYAPSRPALRPLSPPSCSL